MKPEVEREIRLSRLADWQDFQEFWDEPGHDDEDIENFINERIRILSEDSTV